MDCFSLEGEPSHDKLLKTKQRTTHNFPFVSSARIRPSLHRWYFSLVLYAKDFIPWYKPFSNHLYYIENLGIDKGEFRSFPSGHAILSMTMVIILQAFTWFYETLKKKRLFFGVLGLIFALIIIFSRLSLGSHYLSDVSAGAFISSLLALLYVIFESKE